VTIISIVKANSSNNPPIAMSRPYGRKPGRIVWPPPWVYRRIVPKVKPLTLKDKRNGKNNSLSNKKRNVSRQKRPVARRNVSWNVNAVGRLARNARKPTTVDPRKTKTRDDVVAAVPRPAAVVVIVEAAPRVAVTVNRVDPSPVDRRTPDPADVVVVAVRHLPLPPRPAAATVGRDSPFVGVATRRKWRRPRRSVRGGAPVEAGVRPPTPPRSEAATPASKKMPLLAEKRSRMPRSQHLGAIDRLVGRLVVAEVRPVLPPRVALHEALVIDELGCPLCCIHHSHAYALSLVAIPRRNSKD
jgi:hypothetical protein